MERGRQAQSLEYGSGIRHVVRRAGGEQGRDAGPDDVGPMHDEHVRHRPRLARRSDQGKGEATVEKCAGGECHVGPFQSGLWAADRADIPIPGQALAVGLDRDRSLP